MNPIIEKNVPSFGYEEDARQTAAFMAGSHGAEFRVYASDAAGHGELFYVSGDVYWGVLDAEPGMRRVATYNAE